MQSQNSVPKSPVRHVDHITYVVRPENEASYRARWGLLGAEELVRLRTERFPGTHIALTSGQNPLSSWEVMTGFSISEDPSSPINEFIRRYGEGAQHTAYNIDPEVDMDELCDQMRRSGWVFMTPVMNYGSGARLRQVFTAPTLPYGPFGEFVQRLPGPDGTAFNGFDTDNIEGLYEHYAQYSAFLERKRTS